MQRKHPEVLQAYQRAAARELDSQAPTTTHEHFVQIRQGARLLNISLIAGHEQHELLILEEHGELALRPLQELGLTARQAEVLACVAEGLSDREIAHSLSITEHTVGKHLEHIFTRLDVSSRAAAAAVAWRVRR